MGILDKWRYKTSVEGSDLRKEGSEIAHLGDEGLEMTSFHLDQEGLETTSFYLGQEGLEMTSFYLGQEGSENNIGDI